MAALRAAKSTLRKEMKKTLASLTSEEKKTQSEVVVSKLLSSPWFKDSQRLSLFLSMPDEVDTLPILQAALAAGKECFIPQYKGPVMNMVQLVSMEDYDWLPSTRWNIKQPADDDVRPDAIDTGGLDLILVPGLAFTTQGARLGRGKGYYDTYLARCQKAGSTPLTVALAFYQQVVDYVPVGDDDQLIQHVLYAKSQDGT